MTSAGGIRDRIVQHIDAVGFGACGLHVRAGDNVAEHRWAADAREEIHSVAKTFSVLAAGADAGTVSSSYRPRSSTRCTPGGCLSATRS